MSISILLVEDEDAHAELIRRGFEASDFESEFAVAKNLAEARAYIKKSTPSLLIADMNLPDGKGYELIPPKDQEMTFPVVIMTSYGTQEIAADLIKKGALDYIVKSNDAFAGLPSTARSAISTWEETQKRIQAERELNLSREEFADLYDNAPDMFCSVEAKTGLVRKCNKTLAAKLGYTREEIIGQHLFKLYQQSCMPKVEKTFKLFVETGVVENAELELRKKNGETIDVILNVSALRDETGKPLYSRSVWRDVSEAKKAEKLIKENEQRLELILEGADLGTWDWNIQTDDVIFDDRLIAMLGYTRDEFGSHLSSWEKLVHPEDAPDMRKELNSHLEGKIPFFEFEYRLRHKSGHWIWILDRGKVVDWNNEGKPLRACGTHLDITERKLAEEKIKIAQKQLLASQKLAVVGELAAGVSHEVLNPVNIISVQTQMLQRKAEGDSKIQTFCSKVRHEISRIEKILGSLLTFSRHGDSQRIKIKLKDVIEEVMELIKQDFSLDNIVIETNFCEFPCEILADKDQMRQVLLNLVNNAKHAMPGGGVLSLTCQRKETKNGVFAQIRVSDTGTGIKEENRNKIFDPFFTTKPEGEGTGMGLSVVLGIIEEHGGKIRVESEEGKGTTLIISLPASN